MLCMTSFLPQPKPSQLQMVPGAKDIKVVCADGEEQFLSWYAGIRLATHGKQLYDNYYKANVKQFKLEDAEGESSQIEKRMHSISGYRLEKHLDRKREAYQKEQEARETQQQILRGPPVDHEDGSDAHSSEGSRTPEPSPQLPKVAPKPAAKPARNRGPGQSPDMPHQMNEQRPNPPQYPAPATQPPPPPQESYRGHGPGQSNNTESLVHCLNCCLLQSQCRHQLLLLAPRLHCFSHSLNSRGIMEPFHERRLSDVSNRWAVVMGK